MSKKEKKVEEGFLPNITRRDFLGSTLIGSGAALLSAAAPIHAAGKKPPKGVFADPWTGYGGVGDYGYSNGNTAAVRDAAHLIRDGKAPELAKTAEDTGEEYDMVIVGGGFSGMGAAFQFHKKYGKDKKCLILENHPMFGGEAKQNEFDVDGYKVFGPQGSNGFLPPKGINSPSDEIFHAVGAPMEYQFVQPQNSKVKAPLDSYDSMYWGEKKYDVGYHFGGGKDGNPGKWVINPWKDKLARTPWSEDFRADLVRAYEEKKKYYQGDDFDRWLDSMSYKEYLEKEMGVGEEVTKFIDPLVAIGDFGLSADVISAYAAHLLFLPGTYGYGSAEEFDFMSLPAIYSFPGGNAGYLRHIVNYLNPEAIIGGKSFQDILSNPVNFGALDRPQNWLNIRLNATAIDVHHEGDPETASYVSITYNHHGKIRKLKAKSVVMAIGGWVARNIVKDMPKPIHDAYNEFRHGPVLVVNVALRNWRFMDKMGISGARWFEGFGTFCSIRRPMETGTDTQPFDPNKPTVLTFYVPFNYPGYDAKTQGVLGRTELLSKTYRQYEQEIIEKMNILFGEAGFDAERDVAGIVLNRWGHAYIAPQPGYYFGKDGKPAPKEIVKEGFGRIQFGHSELGMRMNYRNAIAEGTRAALSAMGRIG